MKADMKVVMVPEQLVKAPYYHRDLKMNGLTVVESCTHTQRREGYMYLQDHLLLVVLEGTNYITHGSSNYTVRKGEMVVLNKFTQIKYDKRGNSANDSVYDSLLFFIKDEFLIDFMKMASIESPATSEPARVTVKPLKERMYGFFESIKPYFSEPEKITDGLLRLKMLELLYDLASVDRNLLTQLLQLKQQVYADIPSVMEANYANPVTVYDLAYLSGRSVSSFKRDFQKIYQTTPAQWIRERRLAKAKELLTQTSMSVKDVCYSLGFESLPHFSRLFKEHTGMVPSSLKVRPAL